MHPRCERSERCEESPPWAEPARPAVTGEERDAPPLGPGSGIPFTVRRIKLAMASAHPYQNEFALAHTRLTAAVAP